MATKWKSNIILFIAIFLFCYGLSGILSSLNQGGNFVGKNYFETHEFEDKLHQFINYIRLYEINDLSKEDLKSKITVTPQEIDEHRYRFGDLSEQISSIQHQYEEKIQEAINTNNTEIAEMYKQERDSKIEDITKNFQSDDHIREKIVAEKEQRINDFYKELENHRLEVEKYKSMFSYYLTDINSGEVYTNAEGLSDTEDGLKPTKDTFFFRSYPSSNYDYLRMDNYSYFLTSFEDLNHMLLSTTAGTFEGQIAITKADSIGNPIVDQYSDFKDRQVIFIVYLVTSIIALVLSIFMYRRLNVVQPDLLEEWKPYYNRIPLDIRFFILFITSMYTLVMLENSHIYHYYGDVFNVVRSVLSDIIWATVGVTIVFLQAKFLLERIKDQAAIRDDLKKSISIGIYRTLQEAFLNRKLGTQMILLLAVVFGFGLGAAVVVVEPAFILIYAPAFMVVALPVLILIFKRTGYFNRIMKNANELAKGNFEPDLPMVGKSVLATHAANINTLKHGVKTSQKEQAKSERLKTELITNVSHDLRTPLTSIITYTELLKTPNLAEDERDSYIQIIDRKSKRLKVLIDDLFEASKMASGSIELVKEKVDLVQLLEQTLAEYNEAINETTLDFRVTKPVEPVYAYVDGQKLWRVFDNLIGNILKYSLESTRVYVSIATNSNEAVITFKNITKYELGGNVDEMFERFKRGDTSRQTEGSGLGLAIAKSIVDLHEGSLDIEVDGDLFKVTVRLDTVRA